MTRDLFAEALAGADADDQAAFLNVFVRSLAVMCKATPSGSISMQAHFVAKLLHEDTARFLRDLAETHEYLRTEYSDEVIQSRYERIRELDAKIREREAVLSPQE